MNHSDIYVRSVGTELPGSPIDNRTLGARLGLNEEWIDHFIGTKTRYFAVDLNTGKQSSTLADLCARAAMKAMERAEVARRDIDFIVLSTATPDELMPATVNRIADLLEIDVVPTYQLQSGCAGAMQAIDVGTLLCRLPQHRNGLVIGGDVCAKQMRLDRDFSTVNSSELVNYLLFGDGAGAIVLSKEPGETGMKINGVLNQFVGLGRAPGQVIRWFGEGDRLSEQRAVNEDYKAIEERVPTLANEVVFQLLDGAAWLIDDVDYFLPPQLSGRMTRLLEAALPVANAQVINCVEETGNNGNALPFMQLDRLQTRIQRSEKAICICIESSKWIKGGLTLERG